MAFPESVPVRVGCPRVARRGRYSAPSRSAWCRPAHDPRGCVPRRAADKADWSQTRCTASRL